MKEITLEELLEAGCHFGHQVTRQNPKARDYVFEARDNIHIIDLGLTKEGLEEAAVYVKSLAKKGGSMIIVGSKRQAQPIIVAQAKRAKEEIKENVGLFTVTSRWIGGTLTNIDEVKKNYKRLVDLTALLKDDFAKAKYTKKELGLFEKERQKLEMFYGGIANMQAKPDAIFVVDTHLENLAVREATRTGVATVGIVDTNADPTVIDYVIPANDDAVGSLELIIKYITDAWIEGRKEMGKATTTEEAKKEVASEEQKTVESKDNTKKEKKIAKKATKETEK